MGRGGGLDLDGSVSAAGIWQQNHTRCRCARAKQPGCQQARRQFLALGSWHLHNKVSTTHANHRGRRDDLDLLGLYLAKPPGYHTNRALQQVEHQASVLGGGVKLHFRQFQGRVGSHADHGAIFEHERGAGATAGKNTLLWLQPTANYSRTPASRLSQAYLTRHRLESAHAQVLRAGH